MTLTIEQFCDKHNACLEGREWALSNCKDMEEVWQLAKPYWLIWVALREGVLTDEELRLFAAWSARQVQHLMTDERSIKAIEVAERYANGLATDQELAAARSAARDAADAAWSAARSAARDAADAAWSAAWSAARERQAAWLRANCKPNFE
jgi:hypothetical protein